MMLDAVVDQLEKNRCQQKQIRKEFHLYSTMAIQAKSRLMQLTKEQIHLRTWGVIHEKLQSKDTASESVK